MEIPCLFIIFSGQRDKAAAFLRMGIAKKKAS